MSLGIQVAKISFLRRVTGISCRDKVRSSVIHEELGVELLPLCIERSQFEVVRASGKDASCSPPCGDVPGWREAPGWAQIEVERLYLCTGLGMPLDPPVRLG